MKVVLISPHRDDAAFSLSLAVDAWLNQGDDVAVLCCFTLSAYAPFAKETGQALRERIDAVTALRAAEDAAWAGSFAGGTVSMIDLRLEDAPQRLRCSEFEVCGFAVDRFDPSTSAIRDSIWVLNPDALVIPLGLGGHVDHVTARDAAIEAAVAAKIPMAFYEDLPYAARPGVAEEIEASATAMPFELRPGFVQMPGNVIYAIERKLLLAFDYSSQIEGGVAHEIAEFSSQYGGRERLWMATGWREAGLTYVEAVDVMP